MIAYFFYPETKGVTLEHMGEIFGDKVVEIEGSNVFFEEQLPLGQGNAKN